MGDVHRLYANTYYAILFKGLEHSKVWVSARGPGTNAPWMQRDNYLWSQFANYQVR